MSSLQNIWASRIGLVSYLVDNMIGLNQLMHYLAQQHLLNYPPSFILIRVTLVQSSFPTGVFLFETFTIKNKFNCCYNYAGSAFKGYSLTQSNKHNFAPFIKILRICKLEYKLSITDLSHD